MKLKAVKKSNTLLENVETELKQDGIKFFNESIEEEYLQIPSDFSILPPNEIGKYLNAYTQKKNSVRTLIMKYKIILEEAEESLAEHKIRIYADLPAKMSMTEKELYLFKDAEAKESLQFCTKVRAKISMAETFYENLKDAIFNVSRHITLNVSDNEDLRRDLNIGEIRRGWK